MLSLHEAVAYVVLAASGFVSYRIGLAAGRHEARERLRVGVDATLGIIRSTTVRNLWRYYEGDYDEAMLRLKQVEYAEEKEARRELELRHHGGDGDG